MSPSVRKVVRWVAVPFLIPVLIVNACTSEGGFVDPDDAPNGLSRAFGIWAPGPTDTCTQEDHDKYAVVGADGKLYPTWHPPVDPATDCTFGHEHGRNPEGSALFADVGPIPFGYANETIDLFAPHPGYKIEWENDVEMDVGDGGTGILEVRCDVMFSLHQGSAGAGSFIQPQHEMGYHMRCNGGTELHFTIVNVVGDAGFFTRSCDGDEIAVAPGSPAGAPDGGGHRRIPGRSCLEDNVLVPDGENSSFSSIRESWQFSQSLRTEGGSRLVSVGPYFNVFNPSRYYNPAAENNLSRTVDLCFEVLANGNQARGSEFCEGLAAGVTWDDPRSLFDGANRDVDINGVRISNADGPEVWYTDGYGRDARTEPFPGSIRQFIAAIDNDGVELHGPSIGRDRDYRARGVHAPN